MEEYRDVHNSRDEVVTYLKFIDKSSMSDKQKKQIEQFVSDMKLGKAGKKVKSRRIASYLQFLMKLHRYFNCDIDSISENKAENFYKDLQEDKIKRNNGTPYSQISKDEFVKTLKRFLGWKWGNKTLKYRKSISWMKEDYKKSDKRAITLQQTEAILKKEQYARDRCLFMFLFDSGARIEECLNVRLKDIQICGNGEKFYKVHLRGQKTEEADRIIPIPLTTKYLNDWLKEHPTKEENDYLFPIQYDNARRIIKEMSIRVLKFKLKPHELRHSSATHYIQYGGFGAENVGGFYYRYGWKFGSKEALTYIKTYLYSGDIGAEKIVKNIEKNRVEELQNEMERLKESFAKEIISLRKEIEVKRR